MIALIGFVRSIVSTIIGYFLKRSMTVKVIEITEFNKAATAFRAAFVDVIFALRQNTEGKMHTNIYSKIITDEVLVNQGKSKILFEPSLAKLAKSDSEGFTAAWDRYVDCRHNYQQDYSNPDPQIKEESQYCLNHIETLLIYAKPK